MKYQIFQMKNNFFNNSVSFKNKNYLFLVYFFYSLLILILSAFFVIAFINKFGMIDENYNLIVKDIFYAHGPLIDRIISNNDYFTFVDHVKFFLQKTLAIPIIISTLAKINSNIFFVILVKNLLFFSIYFLVCLFFAIEKKINFFNFLILILIPIFIPYNLLVSFNFVYEDCLVALLLPCLYLCLLMKEDYKYYLISALVFFLYFVKTSMFLIVLVTPLIIILLEGNNKKKFLPLLFSIFAILIWGYYGIHKTGKFPFGSAGSSYNTHVMSFSFNKDFHKFYPNKSTDLIPTKKTPSSINDEWAYFDYYKNENTKYLNENKIRFFKDSIIKLKFIFFSIRRDGAFPDKNGNYDNRLRFSLVINKIFFNISILVLFFNFIRMYKFKKFTENQHNLYFFSLLCLNLPPHLIAWATSKHLIGITSISIIYLFYNFIIKKEKIL